MIKRRRRKTKSERRSRGNNKWFIVTVFIIAQIIFLTSSLFQLKSIDIIGDNGFAQSNIFQGVNDLIGKNIFMIKLNDIRSQFKNSAWIKDISIAYSFPGKLKIILNKKKPVALICGAENKDLWYEVAGEGNVLGINQEPSGLLKIVVAEEIKTGSRINIEKVLNAQKIYKALPDNVKDKLNYIYIDSILEYTLNGNFVGYNIDVKLGDMKNLDYKMNLLIPIFNKLESLKTDVASVDLRYSQPIVKVK